MYSRKTVRATPSPMTTSLAPNAPRESVALPPDYTGIAFPTGENSLSGIVRDYPETAIPLPAPDPDRIEADIDASCADPTADFEAIEEAEEPADRKASGELAPKEDLPFSEEPPSPAKEPDLPLINDRLLRSLTLEDVMLLWMLLLLLSSEREDQIYLLLGLLLFSEG